VTAKKLKVLLVDDEPLARQLLRVLLQDHVDLEVVGECSGPEAAAKVLHHGPDILLLDVQMPGVDGFGVLEQLGPERTPVVVFVTAYDAYALRAFDVHALDYVLKPVSEERLGTALQRARERVQEARRGGVDERLEALLKERTTWARRFLVRTRDRTLVVDAEAVDWVEAADYYVSLHVGEKTHLLRETMAELEQRLDPRRFFRVHRSAIVNLERVKEIHPLFRGDCELVLSTGARVRLSRTRKADFEKMFEGPPEG
jgi:two-component system LytT family response regulator